MKRLPLAVCIWAIALCLASTTAAPGAVMTSHVPAAVANGLATMTSPLPGDQQMDLALSLPLRNEADLRDLIEQIYDPSSPNYHKYLSVEEFVSRFGPTEADYNAVINFAKANGMKVVDTAPNRMVVDVEAPASTVQTAFRVTLGLYRHPTENRLFYAPDREPTVELPVPLLHISGLDNFTLPQPKFVPPEKGIEIAKAGGTGPGGQFTGSDLREAYYGNGSLKGSGQSVGLFEFGGYNINDVKTYFTSLGQSLKVPIHGVPLNGVSLSCTGSCNDGEQVIDIETVISMAPALKQVVVYVGSNDVSIFNQMAADNTSKQLSVSWGMNYDETSLDPIFEEMAVQGQTVLVATGDGGSATPGNTVWPADDPYVTAVGGTNLSTKTAGGAWQSETGWSGSAGAPSKNGVPIPSYQSGIADAANDASTKLRNYPDIAATASGLYSCYQGSCSGGNGGTSYAAPQWAGIIALANEQAAKKSQSPVGFFNSALYRIGKSSTAYAATLHDITSGSNGAYKAVKGYDLVTGWGSPKAGLIDELAGTPPGKAIATISYHQVGACNGFVTSFGETNAGANQAFVVYGIDGIDNQTSKSFSFDPSRLFVHQGADNFLSPSLLPMIPASSRVTDETVAKSKDLKLDKKFGALVVQTVATDGASEADHKAYDLRYSAKSSDPDVETKNTDASRTSWPSTPNCSSISLK